MLAVRTELPGHFIGDQTGVAPAREMIGALHFGRETASTRLAAMSFTVNRSGKTDNSGNATPNTG